MAFNTETEIIPEKLYEAIFCFHFFFFLHFKASPHLLQLLMRLCFNAVLLGRSGNVLRTKKDSLDFPSTWGGE